MRFFSLIFFLLVAGFAYSDEQFSPTLTVMIPMRDGVQLPTDIYLPPNNSDKQPCILLRSTAGRKAAPWISYAALHQLGYVIAIQDTRSAIDKEGKTIPYLSDGWGSLQDGYDTVEWLAKSEFTNGKVGTLGFSALGITQLLLAPSAPPALHCQYIGVAAASLYHDAIFPGGQLLKNQVEGWIGMYAPDSSVFNQIATQPYYNEFWSQLDTNKVAHRVNVPALLYGGWYDIFLQGTIDAFTSRQTQGGEGARGKQKLLIGPWTHFWPKSMALGDFTVPKQGEHPPFDISPQRWFEHYLKNVPNGIDKLPAVIYYVMGPFDGTPSKGNVWKTADHWPVPAKERSYYLTADHALVDGSAPQQQSLLKYQYDPHHPAPTLGGRNLFLESGPKDQRPIEQRSDCLVFSSEPLKEDLEVTGRLKAFLYFASDRPDTDIVVRLTDVYPDGRSILVADGLYRTGITNISKDNQNPQQVEVDLWSTSMVFAKGHRIRISITSSNYPRYEKNGNVGLIGANIGQGHKAENGIYVGGPTLSHIVLPVVSEHPK